MTAKLDIINHPPHYTHGTIEFIEVVEDWRLGFNLGNCLKYIARSEHKGTKLADLKKAQWYLNREIKCNNRRSPMAKLCRFMLGGFSYRWGRKYTPCAVAIDWKLSADLGSVIGSISCQPDSGYCELALAALRRAIIQAAMDVHHTCNCTPINEYFDTTENVKKVLCARSNEWKIDEGTIAL